MKRGARRAVSVAIVGAAALATAGTVVNGPHVSAMPPVIDVHVMQNQGTVGKPFTLKSDGDSTANIQSFDQDVALCTNAGMQGSGAPTSIPSGGMTMPSMICPNEPTFTIDRCHFFARDMAAATLGTFTGLCIVEGGTNLTQQNGTTIAFPSTPVGGMSGPGSAVMINTATTPITKLSVQIADQDGNFEVGMPCLAAGPGCKDQAVNIMPTQMFNVQFFCTPKSATALTAQAWIVGDNGTKLATPYTLTCNGTSGGGGPVITANPTSVPLSAKVIGPAQSSTITVANAATAGGPDLHISAILLDPGGEWTFTAAPPCDAGSCTIAAQSSTSITVTFAPTDFGPMRDATLSIASDDPNMATLPIALHGTGLGATLAMGTNLGMPPTLPIAGPINQTTMASFSLTNNGNDTLNQVAVNLAATPGISVVSSPTSIAAGAMPPVTIGCHPSGTTTVHTTLMISSPEALHNTSPLPTIDVSCTGTTGSLMASPNPVLFGEVRTNDGMAMRNVMLTAPTSLMVNDPVLVMTVPGMSVTGVTNPTTPSGFSVLFTPAADGPVSNTAMVTASDASNVPVGITGQVTTADLDVPDTIQAGAFCVGGATSPTAVALRSTGTASIHLLQPALAGGAASAFQLDDTVPTGYPYQLPAQQSAMIAITPHRQSQAGMPMDTIQWTTDMPGKEGPTTTVTATFVESGGAIAPQAIDFGSLPLGQPATDQVVTLRNCGSDAMDLSPAVIAPPNGDFQDTSTMPLPMTLAPNQTATVSVGFRPKHAGLSTGTLTIASSTGELGVTLTGRGLGLDQGARTSFYACGCQSRSADPSGVAPIVIAFGILRRRRR